MTDTIEQTLFPTDFASEQAASPSYPQRVTPRHNAIMDYILANPSVPMGMVAAHFKVSPSWLSIITRSDCFQAQLRDKQELIFHELLIPLNEKVAAVAHQAIEKLGEKINDTQDASFILDTSDKLLGKLGFGAKSPAAIQINSGGGTVNVAAVDGDVLKNARARMLNAGADMKTIENTVDESAPDESKPIIDIPTGKTDAKDGDGEEHF